MFENELTYQKSIIKKENFHAKYEHAIARIEDDLGSTYPLIINGKRINSTVFPDISPINTKIVVGYASKANSEHVIDAIKSAKRSFKEWNKTDYKERVKIMRKAADIISNRKYDLAALITYENGKNRYEAMADVDEAIDFLKYYAQQMEDNHGYTLKMNQCYPDEESYSVMRPYGVFVVISPFNFPLALTTGMCSAALITGNSIVLKPSSDTPITAVKLTEIFEEAGVIAGAINLITGFGKDVGDKLIESKDVDGIVFTGSRDVGLSIYTKANAIHPKPVIMEMGGKNACIVSKHADIQKAITAVARAAFGYSGQKCSACSRLIIDKSIKNDFLNRFIEFVKGLKIGNPIDDDTFTGPVINNNAYERYKRAIEIASRDGSILYGANIIDKDDLKYGYYVEPTIVDKLDKEHEFLKEELFLPILMVIEYDWFEEAISIFNSTDYGLTGGIFSNDKDELNRFFEEAEAGVLYANREKSATTGAMVGAQPFVGWKYSGMSGKGTGGKYYLQLFMREQSRTQCLQ